ncbi:MAG: hypothetical protein NVSMB42_14630 [Herpetosiphon sp.]
MPPEKNYGNRQDIHERSTLDLSDPASLGAELGPDDPLPDIPDAGPDSLPITSPDPIDFSTKGITAAGAIGMSTFNDGDDQSFYERTVDAFEQSGVQDPMSPATDESPSGAVMTGPASKVRIYPRST